MGDGALGVGTFISFDLLLCSNARVKAPALPSMVGTLPTLANLLHVSVEHVPPTLNGNQGQVLFASTADRRLSLLDIKDPFELLTSRWHIYDSPILSCVVISSNKMQSITAGMSGKVILYDHQENQVLSERRDHRKYVVKIVQSRHQHSTWVATAGWDAKVFLYRLQEDVMGDACSLGEPVASLSLATNPETIAFISHPNSDELILLIARRDSTSLHYYQCKETSETASIELLFLGTQNLAPHSNAWISFSPSSIAICPKDPQLLAIATSTVPHMKLIIVRVLFPRLTSLHPMTTNDSQVAISQVSQARQRLAVEDREDAAIQLLVNTFAPQTTYSTPQVCWRPDGSGVWVNGDDGALRGFDAISGRNCSLLKGGHEAGSKIRSIWAGTINVHGKEEEWVVSGGFDKKLVVWKPDEEGDSSA